MQLDSETSLFLLRKAGWTGIESSARGNGSWKGEEKKSVTGFSYFHYPLGPSDFSSLLLFNVAIRLTTVARLCFTLAPWTYFYIEKLWA